MVGRGKQSFPTLRFAYTSPPRMVHNLFQGSHARSNSINITTSPAAANEAENEKTAPDSHSPPLPRWLIRENHGWRRLIQNFTPSWVRIPPSPTHLKTASNENLHSLERESNPYPSSPSQWAQASCQFSSMISLSPPMPLPCTPLA